jgi:hypothetical protein
MLLPCRMLAYGSKFLHPDTTSAADDIIACFCHVAATTMYLKHETMGQVGNCLKEARQQRILCAAKSMRRECQDLPSYSVGAFCKVPWLGM